MLLSFSVPQKYDALEQLTCMLPPDVNNLSQDLLTTYMEASQAIISMFGIGSIMKDEEAEEI